MALPDLQVEPEEAVMSLDACLVKGYQIKDKLNNEYFSIKKNAEQVNAKIHWWRKEATDWKNESIGILQKLFKSPRYAYNFRDAKTDGLMRVGVNIEFEGICKNLQASIDVLNYYIDFLYKHANIEIVNSNVQIGGRNNKQEMKNE